MITDEETNWLIEKSLDAAKAVNIKIAAAIVDPSGYLLSLRRMSGAGFLTPQIAEAKAFSAAAWGTSTAVIAEKARAKPETFQAFTHIGRTKLIPGQGGVLIKRGETTIGALGISGGSGPQDDSICETVLAAFAAR